MDKLSPEQKQTLEERWHGCVFEEHDLRGGMLPRYSELDAEGLRMHLDFDADGVPNEEQTADLVVLLSLEVGVNRNGELTAKPDSAGLRIMTTMQEDEQLATVLPVITLYLKYLRRYLQREAEEAVGLLIYIPTTDEN